MLLRGGGFYLISGALIVAILLLVFFIKFALFNEENASYDCIYKGTDDSYETAKIFVENFTKEKMVSEKPSESNEVNNGVAYFFEVKGEKIKVVVGKDSCVREVEKVSGEGLHNLSAARAMSDIDI